MKTLKTLAILITLTSLPLGANAETTAPDKTAPMAGDMMGMMGGGTMNMGGMSQGDMMGQMMQMMEMMQMMQMAQMMTSCEKMMADMSMMGKGNDPMMNQTTPAPKG